MKRFAFLIALLCILMATPAAAVTRFYLPSTGTAAVSPNYDAAWYLTTDADRLAMVLVADTLTSAMTDKVATEELNQTTTGLDYLNRQYVSQPINGSLTTSIAGTLNGLQIRCAEDNNSANFYAVVNIRVVSNDGTTIRGTLLSQTLDNTEFNRATLENRTILANAALTTVNGILDNDRIVVEVGYRAQNTRTTAFVGTMSFGDNNATDLPVDDTTQTAFNPWIEFQQTINFREEGYRQRSVNLP